MFSASLSSLKWESKGKPNYDLRMLPGKPLWTLRPKSGIPTMYGNDARMQEAKDPETDAFYNGGEWAITGRRINTSVCECPS